MAKFHGVLGFVRTEETKPGVWQEVVHEREAVGDYVQNYQRWTTTNNVNDDLVLSNQVSILADDYVMYNASYLRWIEFKGQKWKVVGLDQRFPRLILTIGGVYNGDTNSD